MAGKGHRRKPRADAKRAGGARKPAAASTTGKKTTPPAPLARPEQPAAARPENSAATAPEKSAAAVPEKSAPARPENSAAAAPENSAPAVPENSAAGAPAATAGLEAHARPAEGDRARPVQHPIVLARAGSQVVGGSAIRPLQHSTKRAMISYRPGREAEPDWLEPVRHHVRRRPLQSILIAAGLGMFIGLTR